MEKTQFLEGSPMLESMSLIICAKSLIDENRKSQKLNKIERGLKRSRN